MTTPSPARRWVSRPWADRMRSASAFSVLALWLALDAGAAQTRSKITRDSDLKAVFLFNFARFVEWPPEAFPEPSSPFVLCILGDDPVGKSLDQIVAHETVDDHRMEVRRPRELREASACHILYVSVSESPRMSQILAALQGKQTLTVGESDQFASHDGMIQFFVVDNRLRLRINVEAAKRARLSISSQLLRQAEIVGAK